MVRERAHVGILLKSAVTDLLWSVDCLRWIVAVDGHLCIEDLSYHLQVRQHSSFDTCHWCKE